jgi:hypothetical protein
MPPEPDEPFVKIAAVENSLEAQLLSSFLAQQGIPHRLRSFHDTAYNGLFQFQKGWGDIYAPADCRHQILEALDDLRSQPAAEPESEPED